MPEDIVNPDPDGPDHPLRRALPGGQAIGAELKVAALTPFQREQLPIGPPAKDVLFDRVTAAYTRMQGWTAIAAQDLARAFSAEHTRETPRTLTDQALLTTEQGRILKHYVSALANPMRSTHLRAGELREELTSESQRRMFRHTPDNLDAESARAAYEAYVLRERAGRFADVEDLTPRDDLANFFPKDNAQREGILAILRRQQSLFHEPRNDDVTADVGQLWDTLVVLTDQTQTLAELVRAGDSARSYGAAIARLSQPEQRILWGMGERFWQATKDLDDLLPSSLTRS